MRYSENGVQYHIGLKQGDVGEYVLMPGDPKRCKMIAQYFDDPVLVGDHREFVTYTGYLDGVKVSVTSTGIGGPSSAIAMEELHIIGANTFIRVGTCGGMQLDVVGGDMVIATGAIRMDGTSKEYAPIEFPAVPDLTVTNALVTSCEHFNQKYHTGVIQCKDSFYGQHDPSSKPVFYELENKWEAWLRLNTLASEMESGTLFVVASYLKVRCGTVCLVVGNQIRDAKGMDNPVVYDPDGAIKVAVEALRILIKQDQEKSNKGGK